MRLYFASQKNKQTEKKQRNTIPVATLRIHMAIEMIRQKIELFQWLRIYIYRKCVINNIG